MKALSKGVLPRCVGHWIVGVLKTVAPTEAYGPLGNIPTRRLLLSLVSRFVLAVLMEKLGSLSCPSLFSTRFCIERGRDFFCQP